MNKIFFVCLLFFAVGLLSCKKKTLFSKVSSFHSGIKFNNLITESDSINPLDKVNIYNGGGIGVGDFNNDGLPDLYFTGNMVSNKLYLNKGDFKFEDITDAAAVGGEGRWARGVAVVDINNDGLLDIYVCNTLYEDSLKRRNILYINTGNDKDGNPHFKNMAKEYGLEATTQSTMASFFDYDNDGDLDMYLTVNDASASYNPNVFGSSNSGDKRKITGKLFRNDFNGTLHHAVFTDVSAQAGINLSGFGHAATTVDFNDDGWKDIYVSDDFISNNILYINNHDGTFTDRSREYFKHTSLNSMGQDVIDINNDGLPDVVELDMSPPDNYRKKMLMSTNSYQNYQSLIFFGNEIQYIRNTLQLNQGPRVGQQGKIGSPVFSEIGFLSGIAQTDWSWTPLVADFDNDGYRDIVVTNGFRKDVSDHDFMTYRKNAYALTAKMDVMKQIPEIKIPNFAFQNKGNLQFEDVSKAWGIDVPSFSNGAVYVDLNNDGAMDMVINNIDDEASIYRNTSAENEKVAAKHFISIRFKGNAQNISGLGAVAEIYYDHGKKQVYENDPYRGYLSSMQNTAHFGLGKVTVLDSVLIKWPGGKMQKLMQVKADQNLSVNINNATINPNLTQPDAVFKGYFKEVTDSLGIHFKQKKIDFIDFNVQKLLPHKLSEYNPALAVGDIDGNGTDDLVIGGDNFAQAQVFLQQPDGKFKHRDLLPGKDDPYKRYSDAGLLLFDANGDGKLDLYAASGGYQETANTEPYQDRLYLNDGKGNFTLVKTALPQNYTSKLCVKACDFNKDGKPDLFISGRVDPGNYPKPVSSIILRNDSQNGQPKFTDVTAEVAPILKNIGMVCDALFTDFDNDGWPDLIMAGEWMPVTFLKNNHGKFVNITQKTGIADQFGWWNSIVGGDFRHTGRTDYIIGNTGQNTLYQASAQYPVYITAGNFTNKDTYDAIPSLFLPDKNGNKQEFPAFGRDDMFKQMISLRKKFTDYKTFAAATMNDILTPEQRKVALRLKANQLKSCFLRNDGNGKFTLLPLPIEAQFSALNGMETGDFDGDGNLDVVMNGNDFGTEIATGRYDALNGLMLKGDAKGGFKPLSILQSGIYIPGDGRALVKLHDAKGNLLLAASQHSDSLKMFKLQSAIKAIPVKSDDVYALIKHKNGTITKQEFYYGSSFLSQSGRTVAVNADVQSVTVFDAKNQQRILKLK